MGMRHPWASLMVTTLLAAASLLTSTTAHAGYDEGKSAYNHGDFAQALHEWRPLAEQGNAKAQKRLGDMYAGAEGVQRNYITAIEWYGKAADQGLAGAQNSLGLIYESGEGVPRDAEMAVSWYRRSASQGNIDGQVALGAMYEYGHGVPQDKTIAYALYNLSPLNRYYAQALQRQLTASQISAGEMLTRRLLQPGAFLKALDNAHGK